MDTDAGVVTPDYAGFFRRQWWMLALGALVGLALAAAASRVVPAKYTAHATVLVQPIVVASGSGSHTPDTVNLDTEAQIVTSTSVANLARRSLSDSAAPQTLLKRVSVTVPANTSVLRISYEGRSAVAAAAGAHAFAQAYLDDRAASAQADVNQQATRLQTQLDSLQKQLQTVSNQLAHESASSAAGAYDSAQKTVLQSQINSLNSTLNQLRTSTIIPGHIIADAVPPSSKSSPNTKLYLAAGLLVGLIVGLGLALLRHGLNRRVRSERDVENAGVDVLATLPHIGVADVFSGGPSGPARAVRQLCNVISAAHRGGATTVTLVGVDVDPSLVVSNIVIGLGDTGQSVTLVCAGEAAESTAALVGCPRGPGLTEVLRNGMLLRDAVLRSPLHRGVQVLRPGSDADWVVDHARPAAVAALLDELRRSADLVIVQSPTSEDSGVAGAQLFAGVTDASLPLIALDETRHDQFLETLLQLSRVGARVMGAVTVHGTADPQRVAASLPPPPASRPRETDPVLPKLAGEPERPAAAASSSPATPKVEPIATPESTEPSNARIIDRPSALDATAPRPSGPLHASTIPTLPSVERRGGLNPAGSGPAERALTDDRGDRADDQAGERTAPVDRDDDTAATTTDTDSDTGGDASREATDHRPVDSALENLRTHFDGIDRSP